MSVISTDMTDTTSFHRPSSLLDNDFYKITMQQGVIRLFPEAQARYALIDRGGHVYPPGFAQALRQAVDQMAGLKLTRQEKSFLEASCPYLDPAYLDFLQGYCYNPNEVLIVQEGGQLQVSVEGLWYRAILWEVPLMSLICELYYVLTGAKRISDEEITTRTNEKISAYAELGVKVAEFGTRRRYSYEVQRMVVAALKACGQGAFVGSSNVHLAMQNQIKPIGTHAHEWFMFHAACYGYKMANALGLENWVKVYRGDLGIALSDTYTTDVFFRYFDKMLAKLFDGVRHDSGDPVIFADKVIAHYRSMGIDPMSKTIIFSDGLNYDKVARIADYCRDKISISFGIGTNFTNDAGPPAMNIVIKMTEAKPAHGHWTPVVKLSDERGKYTGLENEILVAKNILGID
jgi:nicotinate phosphoribosyltransferase